MAKDSEKYVQLNLNIGDILADCFGDELAIVVEETNHFFYVKDMHNNRWELNKDLYISENFLYEKDDITNKFLNIGFMMVYKNEN